MHLLTGASLQSGGADGAGAEAISERIKPLQLAGTVQPGQGNGTVAKPLADLLHFAGWGDLMHQLFSFVAQGLGLALEELGPLAIARIQPTRRFAHQGEGLRRFAIPPGSPHLLDVLTEGAGGMVMDHPAGIRLIDPRTNVH